MLIEGAEDGTRGVVEKRGAICILLQRAIDMGGLYGAAVGAYDVAVGGAGDEGLVAELSLYFYD